MSAVTNLWRQLVQRRLWPVAIVLIAALAAVPLTLAKDAEPVEPPPAAATEAGDDELAVTPIVAAASAVDTTKRRRVLGKAKNPFAKPKPVKAEPPVNKSNDVARRTTADERDAPTGGSTPAASPAPATVTPPVTATPEPPAKQYELHELTVRFGDAGTTDRRTLKRLQPLPSAENPVLIYLGVLADGKTAVFLVDHGVTAVGDGACKPSDDECETIRLKAGETEFFDVVDETGNVTAQYQLDLLKIHSRTTTSATQATASSKAGQRLLKSRIDTGGDIGYRWDAASGALERRTGVVVGADAATRRLGIVTRTG